MITKWLMFALAAFAFAASSWMGAIVYVKTYPQIIEYLEPLTFKDTNGDVITSIKPGSAIVVHVPARRQPYKCWGMYVYVMTGDEATYQFPVLRSILLKDSVEIYQIQNLMMLPTEIPSGRYHWSVVVYPTCDSVDLPPMTIDLKTDLWILAR